ncbi:MAG: hypothetical protein K6F68_03080 [Clostridiales bacterium]|nr:hypothetical protein [Clostridiales bacterium]
MIKTILFVAYTAMIPAVPLYGVVHYTKNNDRIRKTVCIGLFALQCLISIGAIVSRLGS